MKLQLGLARIERGESRGDKNNGEAGKDTEAGPPRRALLKCCNSLALHKGMSIVSVEFIDLASITYFPSSSLKLKTETMLTKVKIVQTNLILSYEPHDLCKPRTPFYFMGHIRCSTLRHQTGRSRRSGESYDDFDSAN